MPETFRKYCLILGARVLPGRECSWLARPKAEIAIDDAEIDGLAAAHLIGMPSRPTQAEISDAGDGVDILALRAKPFSNWGISAIGLWGEAGNSICRIAAEISF